jgi:hypothetical protein
MVTQLGRFPDSLVDHRIERDDLSNELAALPSRVLRRWPRLCAAETAAQ